MFFWIAFTALAAGAAQNETIQAFTEGLQGLEGHFEQRVLDGDGQLREQSSGAVALQAPRQFRWEYRTPFMQTIVADGDRVWIYDPDLEQVTVRRQSSEEQQSPLAALIDNKELDRQFRVGDGGEADGLRWVVLTPRAETVTAVEARLGFANSELQQMLLSDNQGQRTEIRFSHWRRNPNFAADTFLFHIPEGTDVIGEAPEGAEVYPLGD